MSETDTELRGQFPRDVWVSVYPKTVTLPPVGQIALEVRLSESDGDVRFRRLTHGTEYVAVAVVGGAWKSVRFIAAEDARLVTQASASGASASSGSTPSPVVPAATSLTMGTVKLAGDLGGTANTPTVPGLSAKADVAALAGKANLDDARFSDARQPTAHTHTQDEIQGLAAALGGLGGVTPDATTLTKGVIRLAGDLSGTASSPTVPNAPTPGQKNALDGTTGTPGSTNRYVTHQDARLSDARTPVSHSHAQSDVTGLAADLAGKAPVSHTHTRAQITDFAHTHPASEITGLPSGGFGWEYVGRQNADLAVSTTAFSNTDLVFNYAASGVYAIELFAICMSAASATGLRFAFDLSTAVSRIAFQHVHPLANTGTVTGGSSIADDTATGLSSGAPTNGADYPVLGSGLLIAGATAGTARLRFGPEVAAAATLRAGSVLRVHRVA